MPAMPAGTNLVSIDLKEKCPIVSLENDRKRRPGR
jgi:hypothetical protein